MPYGGPIPYGGPMPCGRIGEPPFGIGPPRFARWGGSIAARWGGSAGSGGGGSDEGRTSVRGRASERIAACR